MERNKLSLVAMILGILASIFILVTLFSFNPDPNTAEGIGTSIGMAIILPSAFSVIAATILNIIGYFSINRTITLVSAILYVLGLVLMPLWGFVGIPSMILQFVAFSKMKKQVE